MRLRKQLIGLFALAVIVPAVAHAALININTADAALLDTLPGIGPAKAAAIIDYRTQHGPFVRTEDIQDVSGIGPSTYADIAPLITVGDVAPPPSQPDAPSDRQPSAPTASYKDVQKVETIIGTKGNAQTHEEEVSAPREIGDAAISRGAVLPPAEVALSGSSGLFRSPWTISFFGVMALAGAAFIFL